MSATIGLPVSDLLPEELEAVLAIVRRLNGQSAGREMDVRIVYRGDDCAGLIDVIKAIRAVTGFGFEQASRSAEECVIRSGTWPPSEGRAADIARKLNAHQLHNVIFIATGVGR